MKERVNDVKLHSSDRPIRNRVGHIAFVHDTFHLDPRSPYNFTVSTLQMRNFIFRKQMRQDGTNGPKNTNPKGMT